MPTTLLDEPRFGDAPERLAELLGGVTPPDVTVTPLQRSAAPARVAAVDGSNAVIADAKAFMLGAYRAGVVTLNADGTATREVDATNVRLLERGEAATAVADALTAAGAADAAAFVARDRTLPPDAALGHLRAIAELAAAERALVTLERGDVLLLDGPVRVHPPGAPAELVGRLLESAAQRGVAVVGVSKSTALTIHRFPALAVAARASRPLGAAAWLAPIPAASAGAVANVYAARLSAADPAVFRFDVALADQDAATVLSRVAAVADHPAYPGYPSPLAMAHHAVVLDEGEQRELLGELRRAAEDAGADPALWDLAFVDYHDILDLGA